jgi:hypothetical protein
MKNENNETPGWLYAETVAEMLKRWDNGETIWSVEMGGLGPGYEQAIQVGIVEMCREMQEGVLCVMEPDPDGGEPIEKYSPEFTEASHKVNRAFNLGWSGSQASAAMSVAYKFLTVGPRQALLNFKEEGGESDRMIQVDNSWPGRPVG